MIPHPINNAHSNPIPSNFRAQIIPHHNLRSAPLTSSPLTTRYLSPLPPASPATGAISTVRGLFPLFAFGASSGVPCVASGVGVATPCWLERRRPASVIVSIIRALDGRIGSLYAFRRPRLVGFLRLLRDVRARWVFVPLHR